MSQQTYQVTARKYRPALFKELVAQEHVSETLKNAIRLDRLAHAYLFSGPRGVGKTTAARILAKSINCTTPLEEREDGAEPCRTCNSCQSFEEGRNLNIIEFDAASNNSVDDIRDLREKVRVPPQGGRKKVYIIDEVHMLSNAAFNALLKTLEEPPPHVLFIFATTEPNKVLPTILSRCQRFDFRRIPVAAIVERLRTICEEEGITADDASLMLLARKGDGALRDALSAFDQAVSLCGTDLAYSELTQALGVVDVDLYFETTRHISESDSAGMLRLVERIVRSGYDVQEFLAGLAEHLRNLLVAVTMQEPDLIAATEALRARYLKRSSHFSESDLLRLLMIVNDTQDTIKDSTQPRLKLEMALLKMVSLARSTDLREALDRVARLEEMARSGQLTAASPPQASEKDVREPEDAASEDEEPAEYSSSAEAPSGVHEPTAPADDDAPDSKEAAQDVDEDDEGGQEEELTRFPEAPPSEPTTASTSEPASEPKETGGNRYSELFNPPALSGGKKRSSGSPDESSEENPTAQHSGDGAVATAPAPPEPDTAAPGEAFGSAWSECVQRIKRQRIQVGALLQHCHPKAMDGSTLSIAVPDDFHQRLLRNQHAFLLEHICASLPIEPTQLDFRIQESLSVSDGEETADDVDPYEYMKRKRQENPVIRAIFEHFGGELVW